jgi:tRNA-dihydrouridine synthase B
MQDPRKWLNGSPMLLALAPMQDLTDRAFWKLLSAYGGPDVYFTEYFRVHSASRLDRGILSAITDNPTGRPVVAQIIGDDIPALVRTAQQLQRYPVAAIDLNLGCPAPVVCRKKVGGALLKEQVRLDEILRALRQAITIPFTAKIRLGYDSPDELASLLSVLTGHALDLLTVHGRTVRDLYRTGVRYDLIAQAVKAMPCPVLANGDIDSAAKALAVVQQTGARGVMIGRGAIRNPWIFQQIRQSLRQEPWRPPTGREVWAYLEALFEQAKPPGLPPSSQIERVKKYLNYVGVGIDPAGQFLFQVRRMTSTPEFHAICRRFLDHDRPLALEPFDLGRESLDKTCGANFN